MVLDLERTDLISKLKGAVQFLAVDMEALSGKCQLFGEIIMSRMPRLAPRRVLEARLDLKEGSH